MTIDSRTCGICNLDMPLSSLDMFAESRGGDMNWTIGEVSERGGVSAETIRYYEREGLMPAPPRTPNGRRLYGPSDLQTLVFIRNARELGFNLEETRTLLALREQDDNCTDVKALGLKRLESIRAQKAQIIRTEQILSAALAKCPGGPMKQCSLLAHLEAA